MRRALHDAEERLTPAQRLFSTRARLPTSSDSYALILERASRVRALALKLVEASARASRPARGQFHGLARRLVRGLTRRALVEGHHDVRPERRLHLHRAFRREEELLAVYVRAELYALLRHEIGRAHVLNSSHANISYAV